MRIPQQHVVAFLRSQLQSHSSSSMCDGTQRDEKSKRAKKQYDYDFIVISWPPRRIVAGSSPVARCVTMVEDPAAPSPFRIPSADALDFPRASSCATTTTPTPRRASSSSPRRATPRWSTCSQGISTRTSTRSTASTLPLPSTDPRGCVAARLGASAAPALVCDVTLAAGRFRQAPRTRPFPAHHSSLPRP
jgi:hypothetical protein